MTRISHQMQKHKFGIACPRAIFVESVLVPPKHEKYHVDGSCPNPTGMHYVTHRSHWMQKHMFSITCSGVLFVQSVPVPPEHEK
jgi:hypothetical protein